MTEFVSRVFDSAVVAPPARRWQQPEFAQGRERAPAPPALSLAGTAIRQSVPPRLQPKLSVSHPSDRAELEADRVADAIMQMPAPAAAGQAEVSRDLEVQRACTECAAEGSKDEALQCQADDTLAREEDDDDTLAREEDDDDTLAREEDDDDTLAREEDDDDTLAREEDDDEALMTSRAAGAVPRVTPDLESDIRSMHRSGAPLSRESRAFFEPRLGVGLSSVRVHTGTRASSVARQLNARAFTVGNNITFNEGQYSPGSSEGKRLLAHELTHVVQQQGHDGPADDSR